MKLPVKSLIRFQYVSKHLRTLITSKDFEGRHMSHQKTQAPKLLFVCDDLVNRADNTLLIKRMALVLETTSASVENKECLKFQEFKGFLDISESCDGLVCIYVHNTPSSENSKTSYRLFGERARRYKLVWLYNKYPDSTSLSKKKYLQTDHFTGSQEMNKEIQQTETKLIVFDIHTKMFQVIQTPPFITRNVSGDKIGLCNLDGRLCISELKKDCKQEFWWRVEDNNNTWEKIFSVDLHSTSTWFELSSQLHSFEY
ncbi:unnamed protein product [Arabidopsis thaliana]|uniref:F-box associated domain-containing protein n=1 Tax=Arabidopsis thaliana TaxID=3702 RepID=A0A5S9WXC9_ARATH|nr:unnamed protein product [Arabidopsis thaliana]